MHYSQKFSPSGNESLQNYVRRSRTMRWVVKVRKGVKYFYFTIPLFTAEGIQNVSWSKKRRIELDFWALYRACIVSHFGIIDFETRERMKDREHLEAFSALSTLLKVLHKSISDWHTSRLEEMFLIFLLVTHHSHVCRNLTLDFIKVNVPTRSL